MIPPSRGDPRGCDFAFKSPANDARWVPADDGKRLHVMRDNSASADHCAVTDAAATWKDARIAADPHFVANHQKRPLRKHALRDTSKEWVVEKA